MKEDNLKATFYYLKKYCLLFTLSQFALYPGMIMFLVWDLKAMLPFDVYEKRLP